ncbi:MAG: hypothetical protein AAF350_02020 [Pseudomonadota bacterium]
MTVVAHDRYFDRAHFDDVVLAVIVVDAFSGAILQRGIEAHLEKQLAGTWRRFPVEPRRNATGMLVFVNRRNQPPGGSPSGLPLPPFRVVLDVSAAGYFDPVPVVLNALPADRRLIVRVHKMPEGRLDGPTTSIDGVLVRAGVPVERARVRGELPANVLPPNAQPAPFETLSDERGAFSLQLRLPVTTVTVRFEFSSGGTTVVLNRDLTDGLAHAFDGLIDFAPLAANNAPVVAIPR